LCRGSRYALIFFLDFFRFFVPIFLDYCPIPEFFPTSFSVSVN
jgi:hypothetical protein